ncbi:MAG TPA: single-stranded-DNA-specific exonuclease RecJ [Myxococcota bacterium]
MAEPSTSNLTPLPSPATEPLPRAAVRWQERAVDAARVDAVAQGASLSQPVARVLVGRGVVDDEAAQAYLVPQLKRLPDPARLAGMDAALDRIVFAIDKGETIGIFGDYDVDGVTSTVVLWDFLDALGAKATATIPDRLLEGYGLNTAGVDRLAAQGCTLIITVDCGVTAHEQVLYASGRGIDVVVIDHHTVPVELPKAVSVINPHRPDCTRGSEMLCAAGVTFNLCLALRRKMRERGFFNGSTHKEPDLKDALDLVALGTVADVVPLVGENRVLVAGGLKLLKHARRPGLRALLDVAGEEAGMVDASTLGFQLGPRVNAAGRLGDAMHAVRLLRSSDDELAFQMARRLDAENRARRGIEKKIVEEAVRQIESSEALRKAPVLVVGDEGWHPGVVGIVASRLVDRFGRPAVVVGEGGRGSGRSIERYHLYDALRSVAHTLDGFGGHAHAAGVRVKKGAGGLDAFRDALIAHGEGALTADDLHKVIAYDGELDTGTVDKNLIGALDAAAPFGRKNPEPVFLFRGVKATGVREVGNAHVKAVVDTGRYLEMIAFGAAERIGELAAPVDVLATPEINEFRGASTLQLRVRDFRASR